MRRQPDGAGTQTDFGQRRRRPLRRSPAPAHGVDIDWFDPGGDESLADRFTAVGAALQGSTPGRVVTDLATTLRRLDPSFHFYHHGIARGFVASMAGEDVGRCIATVNDRAPVGVPTDVRVGNIGMWECIDDHAAARELLAAAVRYLEANGCHEIVGPMDFSTWYPYRHSTGPFDGEPLLLEPYSPPHHEEQWRRAGFAPVQHYFSSRIDDPGIAVRAAVTKTDELERRGFAFRTLRMEHLDAALHALYELTVREFAENPYYTPIDWQEFRSLYEGVERGLEPRLVIFAFSPQGNLAGYVFAVPNHVHAARLLDGGTAGFREKLRALRAMRNTDSVLVKTLCVGSSYRSHGLGGVLIAKAHEAALDLGYRRVFHMLMHESNHSARIGERSGSVVARRYALYRLRTARGREAALRATVRSAERRVLGERHGSRHE